MKVLLFTVFTLCVVLEGSLPVQAQANKDLIFTSKEKAAIAKLRDAVSDVNYDAWIKADWSLVHYLRSFKMDVKRCAEAIRETVKWRKDSKIDKILGEKILDLNPPFNTESRAKDGSPVMIWLPARWDIRKYLLAGNREKLIRYFDQMSESAHAIIRSDQAAGKNTTQWFQILDLHNYNLRQHACVTCFPLYYEWVAHWEKHYPAANQHFYYVNTPGTFIPLLELLKPLYSEPTRNSLKVMGTEKDKFSAELLNHVDARQLPKVFGGNKQLLGTKA